MHASSEPRSMGIIQEMREVCQQRRPDATGKMIWAGHWFNRYVSRYFSIYISWLFIKLGISANGATLLIIPIAWIGAALCVPHILWVNVLGVFLMMMAVVLDCVDGEIARWTKKSSIKGLYLDLVSHVLCNAAMSLICGLHLYFATGELLYLVLAFVAYALSQMTLGLHDSYSIVCFQTSAEGIGDAEDSSPVESAGGNGLQGSWPVAVAITVLRNSADNVVVRLAAGTAVLLSHTGAMWPLKVVTWLLVILGVLKVLGDIVSKYFRLLPELSHVKKATY